jgi:hypothetical protein
MGVACLLALSGCAGVSSRNASASDKSEERAVKETPVVASGKPVPQESSSYAKPVATAPMAYPARAVPRRIEVSTNAQVKKDNREKKKEPDKDSALNGYRLALIDSIEAANAGMALSRLLGTPADVVVLRLRVGQEGKPKITVVKAGQVAEFVELAKAAVQRSTPLLPSPTPQASVISITFLFGSDNRFKLQ